MDDAAVQQYRQAIEQNLAKDATGQAASYDVWSPALDKALAAGFSRLLPGAAPLPRDVPDSDQPDPAGA